MGFLLTYRSFTTPPELLALLIARYVLNIGEIAELKFNLLTKV